MNAANDNASPTTFLAGHVYSTRSICNHDCVYSFVIESRTAKSVRVWIDGKLVVRRISYYNGEEQFLPHGSYSMAPVVSASDLKGDVLAVAQ